MSQKVKCVGVVLAGGTGSRLHPVTKVTNKHLLPIGQMPMIFYPILGFGNARYLGPQSIARTA